MHKFQVAKVYVYMALLLTSDISKLVSAFRLEELAEGKTKDEFVKFICKNLQFTPTQIFKVVSEGEIFLEVKDSTFVIVKGEIHYRSLAFKKVDNDSDNEEMKLKIISFCDENNNIKYESVDIAKTVLEQKAKQLYKGSVKEIRPADAPSAHVKTGLSPGITVQPTTCFWLCAPQSGEELLIMIAIVIIVAILAVCGGLILYGMYKLIKHFTKAKTKGISVSDNKDRTKKAK